MFIQKLWEQNPKLVKQQLMLILFCRDDLGEFFTIQRVEEDRLVFKIKGVASCGYIYVEDFKVYDLNNKEVLSPQTSCREWRQFMTRMFGVKYMEALYQYRKMEKQQLIDNFDKETDDLIENLKKYAEGYAIDFSKGV